MERSLNENTVAVRCFFHRRLLLFHCAADALIVFKFMRTQHTFGCNWRFLFGLRFVPGSVQYPQFGSVANALIEHRVFFSIR